MIKFIQKIDESKFELNITAKKISKISIIDISVPFIAKSFNGYVILDYLVNNNSEEEGVITNSIDQTTNIYNNTLIQNMYYEEKFDILKFKKKNKNIKLNNFEYTDENFFYNFLNRTLFNDTLCRYTLNNNLLNKVMLNDIYNDNEFRSNNIISSEISNETRAFLNNNHSEINSKTDKTNIDKINNIKLYFENYKTYKKLAKKISMYNYIKKETLKRSNREQYDSNKYIENISSDLFENKNFDNFVSKNSKLNIDNNLNSYHKKFSISSNIKTELSKKNNYLHKAKFNSINKISNNILTINSKKYNDTLYLKSVMNNKVLDNKVLSDNTILQKKITSNRFESHSETRNNIIKNNAKKFVNIDESVHSNNNLLTGDYSKKNNEFSESNLNEFNNNYSIRKSLLITNEDDLISFNNNDIKTINSMQNESKNIFNSNTSSNNFKSYIKLNEDVITENSNVFNAKMSSNNFKSYIKLNEDVITENSNVFNAKMSSNNFKSYIKPNEDVITENSNVFNSNTSSNNFKSYIKLNEDVITENSNVFNAKMSSNNFKSYIKLNEDVITENSNVFNAKIRSNNFTSDSKSKDFILNERNLYEIKHKFNYFDEINFNESNYKYDKLKFAYVTTIKSFISSKNNSNVLEEENKNENINTNTNLFTNNNRLSYLAIKINNNNDYKNDKYNRSHMINLISTNVSSNNNIVYKINENDNKYKNNLSYSSLYFRKNIKKNSQYNTPDYNSILTNIIINNSSNLNNTPNYHLKKTSKQMHNLKFVSTNNLFLEKISNKNPTVNTENTNINNLSSNIKHNTINNFVNILPRNYNIKNSKNYALDDHAINIENKLSAYTHNLEFLIKRTKFYDANKSPIIKNDFFSNANSNKNIITSLNRNDLKVNKNINLYPSNYLLMEKSFNNLSNFEIADFFENKNHTENTENKFEIKKDIKLLLSSISFKNSEFTNNNYRQLNNNTLIKENTSSKLYNNSILNKFYMNNNLELLGSFWYKNIINNYLENYIYSKINSNNNAVENSSSDIITNLFHKITKLNNQINFEDNEYISNSSTIYDVFNLRKNSINKTKMANIDKIINKKEVKYDLFNNFSKNNFITEIQNPSRNNKLNFSDMYFNYLLKKSNYKKKNYISINSNNLFEDLELKYYFDNDTVYKKTENVKNLELLDEIFNVAILVNKNPIYDNMPTDDTVYNDLTKNSASKKNLLSNTLTYSTFLINDVRKYGIKSHNWFLQQSKFINNNNEVTTTNFKNLDLLKEHDKYKEVQHIHDYGVESYNLILNNFINSTLLMSNKINILSKSISSKKNNLFELMTDSTYNNIFSNNTNVSSLNKDNKIALNLSQESYNEYSIRKSNLNTEAKIETLNFLNQKKFLINRNDIVTNNFNNLDLLKETDKFKEVQHLHEYGVESYNLLLNDYKLNKFTNSNSLMCGKINILDELKFTTKNNLFDLMSDSTYNSNFLNSTNTSRVNKVNNIALNLALENFNEYNIRKSYFSTDSKISLLNFLQQSKFLNSNHEISTNSNNSSYANMYFNNNDVNNNYISKELIDYIDKSNILEYKRKLENLKINKTKLINYKVSNSLLQFRPLETSHNSNLMKIKNKFDLIMLNSDEYNISNKYKYKYSNKYKNSKSEHIYSKDKGEIININNAIKTENNINIKSNNKYNLHNNNNNESKSIIENEIANGIFMNNKYIERIISKNKLIQNRNDNFNIFSKSNYSNLTNKKLELLSILKLNNVETSTMVTNVKSNLSDLNSHLQFNYSNITNLDNHNDYDIVYEDKNYKNSLDNNTIIYKSKEIDNTNMQSKLEKTMVEIEEIKKALEDKDFKEKNKRIEKVDLNKLSDDLLRQFNTKLKRERQRKGMI
ncbi:RNA polymerase beta'' subunit family protein [Helicovermis profundi]|uniref:Uncharacterized protein n=1 Tax=Helicovermis profundi TaxID=3065157 RepID=A0AAU9ECF1_9FIRM|nr:hypothetical protein HLPR_13600 [Clostridia bacterium S502]